MQYDLDQVRAEVRETYQPFSINGPVGPVVFQPVIMLAKEKRKELERVSASYNNAGSKKSAVAEFDEAAVVNLLALVADDPARWRTYADGLNFAELMFLMKKYGETTQLPEAFGSAK